MFGFFSKLRERARASVLLGVADAADDIFGASEPAPADLDRVRALLAAGEARLAALPAGEPEAAEPAKRRAAKA